MNNLLKHLKKQSNAWKTCQYHYKQAYAEFENLISRLSTQYDIENINEIDNGNFGFVIVGNMTKKQIQHLKQKYSLEVCEIPTKYKFIKKYQFTFNFEEYFETPFED